MLSPCIRRYLRLLVTSIVGTCSATFLALLTLDIFDIAASFDLNDSVTGAHDLVKTRFPATTILVIGVVALVVVSCTLSHWMSSKIQWRRSPSMSGKTSIMTRIDSMLDLEEGKSEVMAV
jgi:hypothetical protein